MNREEKIKLGLALFYVQPARDWEKPDTEKWYVWRDAVVAVGRAIGEPCFCGAVVYDYSDVEPGDVFETNLREPSPEADCGYENNYQADLFRCELMTAIAASFVTEG